MGVRTPIAADVGSRRLKRSLALAGLGSVLVLILMLEYAGFRLYPAFTAEKLGWDYRTYMDAAHRFLGGGSFYTNRQLEGPYRLTDREVMYPPTSIPLFALFAYLPAILWWAIPAAILAWSTIRHRPHPVGWLLIGIALISPWTLWQWWTGNPVIWAVVFCGLATHFAWFGPLVLVKPPVGPFALVGIRSRGWWVTAVICVGVAAVMLPAWPDYLLVVRNADAGHVSPLYGWTDISLMCIPIVAWLARTKEASARSSGGSAPTVQAQIAVETQ